MIKILNAKIIDNNYNISINFIDTDKNKIINKIYNMKDVINYKFYNKLKDYNIFKNIEIHPYHISWCNDTIDRDADSMFYLGKEI